MKATTKKALKEIWETLWGTAAFLCLLCVLFYAAVGILSNVCFEIQYHKERIDNLEAGLDPPDYYTEFCTQPRDRSKRQHFWFLVIRCHTEEAPMNTIAIVQARLGSERLPGKVLEEIGGYSAVQHVVARAQTAYHTFIACPAKDMIQIRGGLLAKRPGVAIFGHHGEEEDVLGRFAELAEEVGPQFTTFVRLTADCPFVDVESIYAVGMLVTSKAADYATTNPGANRLLIDGYDAEAFTRDLLLQAHDNAITAYEREHVTPWIRREAKARWVVQRQIANCGTGYLPGHPFRWTLDTQEDLDWFRAVAEEIDVTPPLHPTYEELMALLERRPDLVRTG